MPPSRQNLLELIEETYGVRHPDFDSIRHQFELIRDATDDAEVESDTSILIAGIDTIRNTYEDWEELSEYEKKNALGAVGRMKNLTRSTLKKYDVEIG